MTNKPGIYEIGCKQGRLLKLVHDLAIFLATNDCTFSMSGIIFIQPEAGKKGFPPQYIFVSNRTLINKHKICA